MKKIVTSLFVVSLLLVSVMRTSAAPGDRDIYFGFLGVKTDHDDIYDMTPLAIAQQSDGKLLVAGILFSQAPNRVLLRRYNTNGSVDQSFGLSGFGVTQIYPSIVEVYGWARCLLVQRDGRIVVGGADLSGNATAWRFNPNGELDTSFGSDGIATPLQGAQSEAASVVLSQGKTLFGIYNFNYPESSTMTRLNPNGNVDTTFGTLGSTPVSYSPTMAVAVNPSNGKLVLPGGDELAPTLQHFNSNGTYDTAYGTDGIVHVPLSTSCGAYTMTLHWLSSVVIQSNGNLIVGGAVQTFGGCALASCYGNGVVRLRANDALDTSYGINGFAVRCDGRVTDPKLKPVSSTSDQIMARLGFPISGNGDRFQRYSSGGFQNLSIANEGPVDFLIQSSDGKIVTVRDYGGDIRLARYYP